jgi:hypothetical protein
MSSNGINSCEFIKVTEALYKAVRDFDKLFDDYEKQVDFKSIGKATGLQVMAQNKIVEKRPMRLRMNASKEDFDIILVSGHVGSERYLEWERV